MSPIKPARCKGLPGQPCTVDCYWVTLHPTGSRLLVEAEAIPVKPRYGLVMVNHDTGKGKVLSKDDVEEDEENGEISRARMWLSKHNMTLHRAHFANRKCPIVIKRRKSPEDAEETPRDALFSP